MKSRTRRSSARAFTLVEALVVIVILGILAAVIAPRLLSRVGQSRTSVAQSTVSTLAGAVQNYSIDCGLPESGATLDILWERPSNVPETAWKGPYVNNKNDLLDPWGNPVVLVIPSQHGNADFDIISYGADGQAGGEGENADIISGQK